MVAPWRTVSLYPVARICQFVYCTCYLLLVPEEILRIIFELACATSRNLISTLTAVSRRFQLIMSNDTSFWTTIDVRAAARRPGDGYITQPATLGLHLKRARGLPLILKITLPKISFSGLENWGSPLETQEKWKVSRAYVILDMITAKIDQIKELHIEFNSSCSRTPSCDILCPHQVVERLLTRGSSSVVPVTKSLSLTFPSGYEDDLSRLYHSFSACAHTPHTSFLCQWLPKPTAMRLDMWLDLLPLSSYRLLRVLQLSKTIPLPQFREVLAHASSLETLIMRGCYLGPNAPSHTLVSESLRSLVICEGTVSALVLRPYRFQSLERLSVHSKSSYSRYDPVDLSFLRPLLGSTDTATLNIRVLDLSGTYVINADVQAVIRDCSSLIDFRFRAASGDQSRANCFFDIGERIQTGPIISVVTVNLDQSCWTGAARAGWRLLVRLSRRRSERSDVGYSMTSTSLYFGKDVSGKDVLSRPVIMQCCKGGTGLVASEIL